MFFFALSCFYIMFMWFCIMLCMWSQIADGIKPTLTELEKFEDQPDTVNVECMSFTLLLPASALVIITSAMLAFICFFFCMVVSGTTQEVTGRFG